MWEGAQLERRLHVMALSQAALVVHVGCMRGPSFGGNLQTVEQGGGTLGPTSKAMAGIGLTYLGFGRQSMPGPLFFATPRRWHNPAHGRKSEVQNKCPKNTIQGEQRNMQGRVRDNVAPWDLRTKTEFIPRQILCRRLSQNRVLAVDQLWPRMGLNWPIRGRVRRDLAKFGPNSARARPVRAKLGKTSSSHVARKLSALAH